ncbi:GSCOCT00013875001.3-RA-CDS [Cotesia congregata]|uniref:Odorant receptor n=1 Tax=Cotesia congregata TaxID=51543 RepID=A0A8J2HPP1_COTCN|nr:GSCOCT00013875001.3-RA-CDS [Cotesia congregata]CAG5101719.1 olfactory receptor 39 [Cotesia congregata]
MALHMFKNMTNVETISDVVGFLAPLSVTTMKSIKLSTMQKKVDQLIESVYKPVEFLKYSSDIGVLTTIRTAMYYQKFESILFASILSIVTCIIFLVASELSETGLVMPGQFPFDETAPWIFQIIFFMQFWTIFLGCIWVGLFDLLLLGLIRWINVQTSILQSNYKNCEPTEAKRDNFIVSKETFNRIETYDYFKVTEAQYKIKVFIPFEIDELNVDNDSFALRLKSCIKNQKRIVNCINNFNDTFSLTLCIQIITSNAVTCFYLYQAAWAIKHNKSIIKCCIMFFSVTTELFYYCIYGTLLGIQGDALRESQYNSSWNNYLNREVSNLLINAMIMSIRPIEMKAGYFFTFSVQTFISVLQRAYSFFAILNTMMN